MASTPSSATARSTTGPPSVTATTTATSVDGSQAEPGEAVSASTSAPRAMTKSDAGPTSHADDLAAYIFNVGYMGQHWADVQVKFFSDTLNLHRIILARSPFLLSYLHSSPPGAIIHLHIADDNVTPEAIYTCIHHLYQPAMHLITPNNSRAVLASSLLFGGMPELAQRAYTVCRESINATTVQEWVSWLSASGSAHSAAAPHRPQSGVNGHVANGYGSTPGQGSAYGSSPMPNGASHGGEAQIVSSGTSEAVWEEGVSGRYGEWSAKLKQDVFEFLTVTLPSASVDGSSSAAPGSTASSSLPSSHPSSHPPTPPINAPSSSTPAPASQTPNVPLLLGVYAPLPFPLLKRCLESPALPFANKQDRFGFAKKVIAARKKRAGAAAAGMEEAAVLAFKGGEEGMEVQVTRRAKKGRALWKVEA